MSEVSKNKAAKQRQKRISQGRIRFENLISNNSYANIGHVAGMEEEIVLNFELKQCWDQGQQNIRPQFTSRIILSPLDANRLAMFFGRGHTTV